jgi:organic radical activating enzyme
MSIENLSKKALAERLAENGFQLSKNQLKKWSRLQLVEKLQQLQREAQETQRTGRTHTKAEAIGKIRQRDLTQLLEEAESLAISGGNPQQLTKVQKVITEKREAQEAAETPKTIGRWNANARIHVKIDSNPKQEGKWSHAMFEMLRACDGKTVNDYAAVVAQVKELPKGYNAAGELRHCVNKEWVEIVEPGAANDNVEVGEALQPHVGNTVGDTAE